MSFPFHPSTPPFALRLTFVVLSVVLAATLQPALAEAQEAPRRPTALVRVANVSLDSAYTLAENVCRNAGQERYTTDDGRQTYSPLCHGVSVLEDENMLSITAAPEVVAQIESLLGELDRLPETRSFQIIVLSASRGPAGSTDVPSNVAQALQDVRDFLPYTEFSVVGSGWLRTAGYGTTALPGAEDFVAELNFRRGSDAAAPLVIETFSVYRQVPIRTQVSDGYTTQFVRRNVLQTMFTISPGETVVVGTSKLDGDDTAMVVLLTAVQN